MVYFFTSAIEILFAIAICRRNKVNVLAIENGVLMASLLFVLRMRLTAAYRKRYGTCT